VPSEILDDLLAWNYALLHGDDEFGCGWSVRWLSANQARTLLNVIVDGFQSDVGLDLVQQLRLFLAECDAEEGE